MDKLKLWFIGLLWKGEATIRMNVKIYSREAVSQLLNAGSFPENTAVISFYDPPDGKRKSMGKVDYSSTSAKVFYVPARDIDPPVLTQEGLTYDDYFPEADELAAFILQVEKDGLSIICQCEYGQSRSAACAAAIRQHFHKDGIEIFADYRYYPNQMIYHKVFEALERAENR